MSSPLTDEVLFFYIAVAPHAMSLVLIRIDNEIQWPVYYVSKSLHEAEIRYLPLEKAILAVVHGTRKLSYYFKDSRRPNSTSTQGRTPKRRLYGDNCEMEHHSGGF